MREGVRWEREEEGVKEGECEGGVRVEGGGRGGGGGEGGRECEGGGESGRRWERRRRG